MSGANNTLLLRLEGPMQSWGTSSRLQLRRTDRYPSKSGVLGLLLCAMGVRRNDAEKHLPPLVALAMGVRLDYCGVSDWDYHTAGAGIGIRQAKGEIKFTASTGEPETLLSRREYLHDASFLAALQGDSETVQRCAAALKNPVWPVYLGRKACIPSVPVYAGMGDFPNLGAALESLSMTVRPSLGDTPELGQLAVETRVEHLPGTPVPSNAVLVYDVPRTLVHPSHGPRWVVPGTVTVTVSEPAWSGTTPQRVRGVDYTREYWRGKDGKGGIRAERLRLDSGLCVFCKAPAVQVHHVTYENVPQEKLEDLRSLCENCHDACTQIEYGTDMRRHRIDPADPAQRPALLRQLERLMIGRRLGRRRDRLAETRALATDFFEGLVGSASGQQGGES